MLIKDMSKRLTPPSHQLHFNVVLLMCWKHGTVSSFRTMLRILVALEMYRKSQSKIHLEYFKFVLLRLSASMSLKFLVEATHSLL